MRLDGGYRAWRQAVADGWTVAAEASQHQNRLRPGAPGHSGSRPVRPAPTGRKGAAPGLLHRAQKSTGHADPPATPRPHPPPTGRSGARSCPEEPTSAAARRSTPSRAPRPAQEPAGADNGTPAIAATSWRCAVTSELADVDRALAEAEDAWLELEEVAHRGHEHEPSDRRRRPHRVRRVEWATGWLSVARGSWTRTAWTRSRPPERRFTPRSFAGSGPAVHYRRRHRGPGGARPGGLRGPGGVAGPRRRWCYPAGMRPPRLTLAECGGDRGDQARRAGLASMCDEVWLVTCDPAAQRERLLARGTSGPEAASGGAGGARQSATQLPGRVRRGGKNPGSHHGFRPRCAATD